MRLTISLALFFLIITAQAQSLDSWSEILFQSQDRSGDYQEIRITPDSVHYQSAHRRSGKLKESHVHLKRKEKKCLKQLLIPLSQLDFTYLESPTNKRAYDGAAHSQITIKSKDLRYNHYFDDEMPHEKLVPLLAMMLQLAEK